MEHLGFFFSERPVLDSARHDYELSCFDPFFANEAGFAIVHAKAAFYDQEQFIFVLVMMPRKRPLKLHELEELPVEFAGNRGKKK